MRSSDELSLPEYLLQGGISLSSGSNETRDGDSAGLTMIDSAIFVDLNRDENTSAMESWIEEWSLEVMMRSV